MYHDDTPQPGSVIIEYTCRALICVAVDRPAHSWADRSI